MTAKPEVRALVGGIGKTGTGKSSEIAKYAAKCRRLIVADPEGSWKMRPGDIEVGGYIELFDRLEAINAHGNSAAGFRFIYRDTLERLRTIPARVALAVRHCTLVLDELAYFCTASKVPAELERVVLMGRKLYVNLLYTTQRPQRVHNIFLEQAQYLMFFRLDPGKGLDRVREHYGALADELVALNEHPPPVEFRTYGNPKIVALFGKEGLAYPPLRSLQ